MPRIVFSTDAIEPASRWDAWRSLLGLSHDVEALPTGFSGCVSSTTIDRLILREMTASAQTVERSPPRVRADGIDHVVLHLTTTPFAFEAGDLRRHVPAGSLTVNALSQPFRRSAAPEDGSIILSVSRDLLAEHLPDPEAFHGLVIEDGANSAIGAHMLTLARNVDRIGPAEAGAVARATAEIVAHGLGGGPSEARTRGTSALVRCKRYIERSLSHAALSPDAICRGVGISRSALYRLFERHDGVANYIRARRLQAAHIALCSQGIKRVSDIPDRYGFVDLPTFSRQFRATYGLPPSMVLARKKTFEDKVADAAFAEWIQAIS